MGQNNFIDLNFPQGKIRILNKGVIRTPILPFFEIAKLKNSNLKELAGATLLRQSILLSSPSFFYEMMKWVNGEVTEPTEVTRIEQTLYKYLARMASRATPFGLFGTIGFANLMKVNSAKKVVIEDGVLPRIRFSTVIIQLLINKIEKEVNLKSEIRFIANNSIYLFGDQIRYYEPIFKGSEISYTLNKVESNSFLERVLLCCKGAPKSLNELLEVGMFIGLNRDEVEPYLLELVDSKLLMSELNLTLTKSNPFKNLVIRLNKLFDVKKRKGEYSKNEALIKKILELQDIVENATKSIEDILQNAKLILDSLEIDVNPKDILHVDTYRELVNSSVYIKSTLIEEIKEIRQILLQLNIQQPDKFKKFKERYRSRYGERTISLLKALDPETGVGYQQEGEQGGNEPLLANTSFNNRGSDKQGLVLTKVEQYLLKKVLESKDSNVNEIIIKSNELDNFKAQSAPISQSVMFSLFKGGEKVLLHEFSGSSAINLINRFSYLDTRIKTLCEDINSYENQAYKEFTLAEVLHLPETKSGNILIHEPCRKTKIPCVYYQGDSDSSNTILLSDILIKIDENEGVMLFSEKTGKRIIPKISSAINYDRDGIDVYKFLGDLQFQNKVSSLYFGWHGLRSLFNSFPRVCYKNITLSPAIWVVQLSEIDYINPFSINKDIIISGLIKERKLPSTVFLATDTDTDNRLFIDFENDFAINVFINQLKTLKTVYLFEALMVNDSPVYGNKSDGAFVNELIFPVVNNLEGVGSLDSLLSDDLNVDLNTFIPGSKWVYIKVYTGHFTTNSILINDLFTIAKELTNSETVKKWFFVRYFDNDYHLRIRFLLHSSANNSKVISRLEQVLSQRMKEELIHKVTIDTYKPEMVRYGALTMDSCESIFYYDSVAVCSFLKNDGTRNNPWIFAALGIDAYFNDFGLSLDEKIGITKFVVNGFFREFNISKKDKLSFDKKYRSYRQILFNEFGTFSKSEIQEHLYSLLKRRSNKIKPEVLNIKKCNNYIGFTAKLNDLIISLIHMFLNRLFTSSPRKQELVVYYLLYKHYLSIKAINKNE